MIKEYSHNQLKVLQRKLITDTTFYYRYWFKHINNKKAVINKHHIDIVKALDNVYEGKTKRLIINIAPRYNKTELAVKNFISKGFALNPKSKFLHVSYSQELAIANSEEIRDNYICDPHFQELFGVKLKQGSTSKKKWHTEQGGVLYATATGGQVTGFGAGEVDRDESDEFFDEFESSSNFSGAIIIDDPIKPEDADHKRIRDKVNTRYESTLKNRVNSVNTPIIVIMQRLHEEDLCGYLIEEYGDEWEVLSLPCIQKDEDGNDVPLWEFKHSLEWLYNERSKNPVIFGRQYMQDPMPLEGMLYDDFKTYNSIPSGGSFCYIDTADTGSDFLCAVFYVVNGSYCYVQDVVYDDRKNEITEPIVVDALNRNQTSICYIESNNGGRAYGRNLERMSRDIGNGRTNFKPFTQTKNKEARILSNASNVVNNILMPYDWETRFKKFHKDITGYLAKGKNAHDDCADALTGVYEKSVKTSRRRIL